MMSITLKGKKASVKTPFITNNDYLANSFLQLGLVDEIISYTSNNELGDKAVSWFKENNAIENYGFKLESSYKIDSDIKEVFKKNG